MGGGLGLCQPPRGCGDKFGIPYNGVARHRGHDGAVSIDGSEGRESRGDGKVHCRQTSGNTVVSHKFQNDDDISLGLLKLSVSLVSLCLPLLVWRSAHR